MTEQDVKIHFKGVNNLSGPAKAALGSVTTFADGTIGHFKRVTGAVFNLQNAVVGLGAGMALKTIFAPTMDMEDWETQYEAITKDPEKAMRKLAGLEKFSLPTPFTPQEIIQQGMVLDRFTHQQLDTYKMLTLVGDTAASVGRDKFGELAQWVGRAYAGIQAGAPIGEATMRLMEIGAITPQVKMQIEAMTEAGASSTDIWEALTGALKDHEGAMARFANNSSAKISILKGQWVAAMAQMGGSANGDLKDVLDDLIGSMDKLLESGDLQASGAAIGEALSVTFRTIQSMVAFIDEHRATLTSLGMGYVAARIVMAASAAISTLSAAMAAWIVESQAAAASNARLAASQAAQIKVTRAQARELLVLANAHRAANGQSAIAIGRTAKLAKTIDAAMSAPVAMTTALTAMVTVAVVAGMRLRALAQEARDLYAQTAKMEATPRGKANDQIATQEILFRTRYKKLNPQASNEQERSAWRAFATKNNLVGKIQKATGADKFLASLAQEGRSRPGSPVPGSPPPGSTTPTPAQKAAADSQKKLNALRDKEKSLVKNMAAAEADRAKATSRDTELKQLQDAIDLKRDEITLSKQAADAAEKEAAAAKQKADAQWQNVVRGKTPAGAEKLSARDQRAADRAAAKKAASESAAEAKAQNDLADARMRQREGFSLSGHQKDLLNAADAKSRAAGQVEFAKGEALKAQMAKDELAAAQKAKDDAIAKFAQTDYQAGVDEQVAKLQEIRDAIATLAQEGGLPPGSPDAFGSLSSSDEAQIADAIATLAQEGGVATPSKPNALTDALPAPPGVPTDYSGVLANIASNTALTARAVAGLNIGMGD